MIYLLLLILPLLISSQECGSHFSDDGNPLARILDDRTDFSIEENRLIGGVETEPHAWPWTVQLVYMGKHRCGGALIGRSFVVTAAHCFARSRLPERYTVYTGGHTSLSGQPHQVLNISVHPFFNAFWASSFDVAVMKISPEVTLGERAQPICLPLLPPPDNKICVVAGWGLIHENGTKSTILREIHVPIVPLHVCNNLNHYAGRVHTPTMVCAGYSQGRIDSCQGDSGGPLMCERAGKWELQGVVSWGIGCGRVGNPGVYARILPALGFLHSTMFLLRSIPGMIYLLLLTFPLLITPQEHDSPTSKDGNPLARRLNLSMPENRIVGGVETEPHAWPWTVQLVYMGKFQCGGSLVDRSFVVTAAHCLGDRRPERYTVYTGGHRSLTGQEHKVTKISVHPLFNIVWQMSYDVAIIKISPEVTIDESTQLISLPLLPPLDNQMCVVAGWGRTNENGRWRGGSLREIRVPIIPTYECNNFRSYAGRIHMPSMMCAGSMKGDMDSCNGDSGGPLMCQRADQWELQGVVSWGYGCARKGHPGVYSRVFPVVPFLKLWMFLLR